jgi:hypothetical protein
MILFDANDQPVHVEPLPEEPIFDFSIDEHRLNSWIQKYLKNHPNSDYDDVLVAVLRAVTGQIRGLSFEVRYLETAILEAIDTETNDRLNATLKPSAA